MTAAPGLPTAARTRTRAVVAAAVVLLAGLLVGPPAGPAVGVTDDPTEGGLWYYTLPGLPEIHDSGVTGEGITVAVIDGPIHPDSPDLAGTDLILPETSFCDVDDDGVAEPATATDAAAEHATAVTSLIIGTGAGVGGEPGVQGVAPEATVRLYVHGTSHETGCTLDGRSGVTLAVEQAIDDGADIISMPFSGWGGRPDALAALTRAQRAGVILVAASSSDAVWGMGWPAGANGVIAVEAADVDLTLTPDTVSHPRVAVVAPGVDIRLLAHSADWQGYGTDSGTSLATAWTSGVLALAWSAYPEATANQMIQALLRTTAQSDGDLTRVDDYWGYGTVKARDLVAIDPTTLPDVNPLLSDDLSAIPRYERITGPEPVPEPTPEPEPTQAALPVDPDSIAAGLPPALVIALVNVLVLAGAAVAALLIHRRTTTSPAPRTTPDQGG